MTICSRLGGLACHLCHTATTTVGICGVVLLLMAHGDPAEASPLKIKNFEMKTTNAVRVPGSLTHTNWGFENQPAEFSQAGGRPDALTTRIDFETEEVPANTLESKEVQHFTGPTSDPKDIVIDLPPGLLGDPMAIPKCPLRQALSVVEPCPASTQIGIILVRFSRGGAFIGPIVNVVPEAGQSAEFAIEDSAKVSTLMTAHLVRTDQGYGFDLTANGILEDTIRGVEATIWGTPAAANHDPERGLFCEVGEHGSSIWECGLSSSTIKGVGDEKAGVAPVPFLAWPSDCAAGSERALLRADSWEEPGHVGVNGKYEGYAEAEATLPAVTGCDLLQFNAGTGIEIEPDTAIADEPVGLGVRLSVPQNEKPSTNSAPELRDTRLTLPEGISVSPSIVDGIQACHEFGPAGINITGPESEDVGPSGELQLAPGHCPNASIVGTAEAITPFLQMPVKGHVYLAAPGCGGPGQQVCTEKDALDGNLYKLYLELGGTGEFAGTGIEFKVAGDVEVNTATGQLTTRFDDLVQAPYSEVKVRLNGGPRAPLDNPATCGPAVATADFTPWSAPGVTPQQLAVPGTPDSLSSSFFNVEGCNVPPSLTPGLIAGSVEADAGQFTAFTFDISRRDREQYFKGIELHTPPGLLAMLSSVPLCGEPEATSGKCREASRIGKVRVASGAGSHPFEIEGSIYLTGPYHGAPFGLSVVTQAVAGPFNLGTVVVRARIDIDQHDATARITADETGPYALPQILLGVPLRLKRIAVNVDRPKFMLNPTSCGQYKVEASIIGSADANSSVRVPFTASRCSTLTFRPHFSVSASGHTSRRNGADLDVRLTFPKDALGREANLARVSVRLPKELPSRLETLQRACPDVVFEHNPAGCPRAAIIGIARARTPILAATAGRVTCRQRPRQCRREPPVSVIGPAYFVSHGGARFPDLVIVLESRGGVRVDLVGETSIKQGITSSTFKMVPDVPVSEFELYLPKGRRSALAALGSLCKVSRSLWMPTEMVAQNGIVFRQRTKITVNACERHGVRQGAQARKSSTPVVLPATLARRVR